METRIEHYYIVLFIIVLYYIIPSVVLFCAVFDGNRIVVEMELRATVISLAFFLWVGIGTDQVDRQSLTVCFCRRSLIARSPSIWISSCVHFQGSIVGEAHGE